MVIIDAQRATAKDLLEHPFIRAAGQTSQLASLVQRLLVFKKQNSKGAAAVPDFGTVVGAGTVKTEWDFDDTIRGTIKGAPVAFDLSALREDAEEDGFTSGTSTAASTLKARPEEVPSSTGTVRAVQPPPASSAQSPQESLVEQVVKPAIGSVCLSSIQSDTQVAGTNSSADTLRQLQQGFESLNEDDPDLVRRLLEQLTMRIGR